MMELSVENLTANRFKAFIEYAFSICDSVSFTFEKYDSDLNEFFHQINWEDPDPAVKIESVSVHPDTGSWFEGGVLAIAPCLPLWKTP